MNRIAVVGIGGSGKSTFARVLAERITLPLFHMDKLFWRGNWEEVPASEYLPAHQELVEKEKWIIEGFVDESMRSRTECADLVIYLDFSGIRCLYRVLKRFFQYRKKSRPELHEDALEEVSFNFWWTVLTRGERPGIEVALANVKPEKVIRLRSPKEVSLFLSAGL